MSNNLRNSTNCKSLATIQIPTGTREKFEKMLDEELWDKLIEK